MPKKKKKDKTSPFRVAGIRKCWIRTLGNTKTAVITNWQCGVFAKEVQHMLVPVRRKRRDSSILSLPCVDLNWMSSEAYKPGTNNAPSWGPPVSTTMFWAPLINVMLPQAFVSPEKAWACLTRKHDSSNSMGWHSLSNLLSFIRFLFYKQERDLLRFSKNKKPKKQRDLLFLQTIFAFPSITFLQGYNLVRRIWSHLFHCHGYTSWIRWFSRCLKLKKKNAITFLFWPANVSTRHFLWQNHPYQIDVHRKTKKETNTVVLSALQLCRVCVRVCTSAVRPVDARMQKWQESRLLRTKMQEKSLFSCRRKRLFVFYYYYYYFFFFFGNFDQVFELRGSTEQVEQKITPEMHSELYGA